MSTSTLFTHNGSQAVHLPADARFGPEVKRVRVQVQVRVRVRVRGHQRIIVPVGHEWGSFFAASAGVNDDFLPGRAAQLQPGRDARCC